MGDWEVNKRIPRLTGLRLLFLGCTMGVRLWEPGCIAKLSSSLLQLRSSIAVLDLTDTTCPLYRYIVDLPC